MKKCKKAIIEPLQIIINQALTTGIFPDKLKIAKVQPIYKNEEQTLIKNYRPISLLPSISKVFEKIIFNQLYSFLQKQNIIYKSQYGFRREHSTEFATLELIDRVNTEMDNNEIPFNIYLDLSKAFDTLDHNILLDKLHYYDVRNTPLDLSKNYLTNRKQYVEIDSVKSKMGEIQTGVPQLGSILGPMLFIIYINDIKTSTELFNVITYADDTTLMSTLGSFNSNQNQNSLEQNINEELNKISGWLKVNKLSLNAKKSKFMIFKRVNKTVEPLSFKIENTNIERVTNFNFLGLTISDNLEWKTHVQKIANKCNNWNINKIKTHITSISLMLYNSLLLPQLNYCILAWGHNCKRLIKLQKKALRIISISKYIAHTDPLFKKYRILKLPHILQLQELKFYHKYINKKLPSYLQSIPLKQNKSFHGPVAT